MFGLDVDLSKRNPGLDLARTVAITLVVFAHTLWISNHYPPLVSWLMQLSGTIGVEIFFVISGFLIGKIVMRLIMDDDFSVQSIFQFLKRRWYRTLPNYYFVLFLNLILWYAIYQKIPEKLILYFVYLQNFTTTSPDFYRVAWSLSVEQFCYIIGPFTLFFLIRFFPEKKRSQLFLWMCLFIIAVFFGVRLYYNLHHETKSIYDWNENLRKVSVYRLDAIYYGFVLYYFFSKGIITPTLERVFFVVGFLGVFILHIFIFAIGVQVQRTPFFFDVLYLPLNSIAICLTIPYLARFKMKEGFVLKWVTLISLLAYSIYLLHYTVILHAMKTICPSENLKGIGLWIYTLVYWLLVISLSYLLYRFFEKPMTNLRDKN
ncbi:acyltransferase [Flavobacterium amniphilum]|uniref:acyltransferase family protein n=1 Tax=Flavobacterium amniphilum TaxID=1834035 RepID=UPI002029D6B0|nr:acyltransferase [Flavobacterium amniphilum]MCL9806112.1 acyltransferase [Flavobacterium amniphilum]